MPHSIYVQLKNIALYGYFVFRFRYYLMQKAKAATTVGILVGTLATGSEDVTVVTDTIIIPLQLVTERSLIG